MAITLEQKEKKEIKFSLPLWLFGILITILIFGVIFSFLFFGESKKVQLEEAKKGLTKEEITKIEKILREIEEDKSFQKLVVIISEVVISEPAVDSGKLGKPNPFSQ